MSYCKLSFITSMYPSFWNQIQAKMGLNSIGDIAKFRDILNFMGYSTIQSVAKLQQQKELDRFVIEAGKLHSHLDFCEQFEGLNVIFGPGDILVLKQIAMAAIACMRRYSSKDEDCVQVQTYERCKKVRIV